MRDTIEEKWQSNLYLFYKDILIAKLLQLLSKSRSYFGLRACLFEVELIIGKG